MSLLGTCPSGTAQPGDYNTAALSDQRTATGVVVTGVAADGVTVTGGPGGSPASLDQSPWPAPRRSFDRGGFDGGAASTGAASTGAASTRAASTPGQLRPGRLRLGQLRRRGSFDWGISAETGLVGDRHTAMTVGLVVNGVSVGRAQRWMAPSLQLFHRGTTHTGGTGQHATAQGDISPPNVVTLSWQKSRSGADHSRWSVSGGDLFGSGLLHVLRSISIETQSGSSCSTTAPTDRVAAVRWRFAVRPRQGPPTPGGRGSMQRHQPSAAHALSYPYTTNRPGVPVQIGAK
jgi:hypothetical protein